MVGGVAVLAIIAFAWYKVKTHHPVAPAGLPYTSEVSPQSPYSPYQSPVKDNFLPATATYEAPRSPVAREMPVHSGPQGGIRYPENISANLGYEN